jgi:hypothetical protein
MPPQSAESPSLFLPTSKPGFTHCSGSRTPILDRDPRTPGLPIRRQISPITAEDLAKISSARAYDTCVSCKPSELPRRDHLLGLPRWCQRRRTLVPSLAYLSPTPSLTSLRYSLLPPLCLFTTVSQIVNSPCYGQRANDLTNALTPE